MSGVNKFLEKVKQEIIMLSNIIIPLPKKRFLRSKKVRTNEEVKKGPKCWMIFKSQSSSSVERIWITFRGNIQDQRVGLIMTVGG